MKCIEIEPLIYLIREGELTIDEKKKLENHLKTCVNCRKLYESVISLSGIIHTAGKSIGSVKLSGDYIDTVMKTIEKDGFQQKRIYKGSYILPILRGLAASFIALLLSTWIYQEADFQKSKASLKLRIEHSIKISEDLTDASDCILILKKRFKTTKSDLFTGLDYMAINNTSEIQLSAFIQQVCGSDIKDISALRRLLFQAGFLKADKKNQ